MYVYIIINKKNKDYYVGMTKGNTPNYFGSGKLLRSSIKEFGKSNFRMFILFRTSDIEKASYMEAHFISLGKLKWPDRSCLNQTSGGVKGYRFNEAVKKKLSELKTIDLDVDFINRQYSGYNMSLGELAIKFNVSKPTIARIVTLKKKCNGSGNGMAKLKEPDVLIIRDHFKDGLYTKHQLAKKYGVGWHTINDILRGATWQHI